MNKLFTWDDLECVIQEREPADLFFCNAEGGWDSEGFLYGPEGDGIPNHYKHGEPAVEVRNCGRFMALETWAPDAIEAVRRFRWHERFVQVMDETDE
jgi:hypothetical protein